MKPYTYAFLAAAAACGLASAAETAYTTPVGYVTLDVPALADTTISTPLEQPSLYSGASTGISGNDISASGLTADAFVNLGSDQPKCYVQVTSGSLSGRIFSVASNSATSITVVGGATTLEAQGFATGNTFKVVPYWTLQSLFPNGTGVGTTNDVFTATSFVLFTDAAGTGPNRASSKLYFYCTGDVGNDLPAGWYDNDDVFGGTKDNVVIDPARMYSIRSSSATAQSVVVTGQVPSVSPTIKVPVSTDTNDVYLGSVFPIDTTLAESGLQSVVQATDDVFSPIETIFVFDDAAANSYNKAASKLYFYCSGDTVNDLPAGWYDNDDVFAGPVTTEVLKAGRAFVIRKAPYVSAGALDWTAPLPY